MARGTNRLALRRAHAQPAATAERRRGPISAPRRIDALDQRIIEALQANGREAFGILGFEDVDLVLTDLVMPDREGIEMIQEIRRRFPGVKTVAMSGMALAAHAIS